MTNRCVVRFRWAGLVAAVVVTVVAARPAITWAADAVPGSAGTDTSLPLTDSKLTVNGRGRFSDLRVTVNQTRNLANQAVSVVWTGGAPTREFGGQQFGENFLQIFQCWGDDDGSNPGNPGPPPQQCEQGAIDGVQAGRYAGTANGDTLTRRISKRNLANFDPTQGVVEPTQGGVWLPFRAVDGKVVPVPIDPTFNEQTGAGNYWLNPYFNIITTNEVALAATAKDGTGSVLFEATTGLESSGLGCGQKVEKMPDGSTRVPRCWLVVIPRGDAVTENEGSGVKGEVNVANNLAVGTSPIAPRAWQNRISIPLDFNPVDSCSLSADQRRIVGSELLSAAVASWQPRLCATPGLSPYAYAALSDGRARQQLVSGAAGATGLAVVSRPLDPATVDPQNPVVYAPLSLSGTVIGFNIERIGKAGTDGKISEALQQLLGQRVAELNLTPRLVAKLLTQSYRGQVSIGTTYVEPWSKKNPYLLMADPDFLQFNPEFAVLTTSDPRAMSALVVAGPNSDAAQQVWEWVFADPEAREWLGGTPDQWGMNANPFYSISPAINPLGVSFGEALPDSYPKSDPHCAEETVPGSASALRLCLTDWMPYVQGLKEAARATRVGTDGAKIERNRGSGRDPYKSVPPQQILQRGMLSMTDSASAAQYGVQTARLSRAGDDTPERRFVAPDQAGMASAAQALTAKAVPGFLEPNPTTAPPDAYPLTALTYGAATPLSLDTTARHEYAAFIDYAAGPGQEPGVEYGQLPRGYLPLPDGLRAQATAAAAAIRDAKVPDEIQALASATGAAQASGSPQSSAASPSAGPPTSGATASSPTRGSGPSTTNGGGRDPQPAPRPRKPLKAVIEAVPRLLRTQAYRLAATRYALPVLVAVALLAGLGALELSKRRSRLAAAHPPGPPDTLDGGEVV